MWTWVCHCGANLTIFSEYIADPQRACMLVTHQAAGSYSAHILTYSSRWWGPRMDESLVRYSKLSMMTATNRFSICTSKNLLDTSAEILFSGFSFSFFAAYRWVWAHSSYQEWTEENKGDKVEVGKLAATLRVCVPWQGVTLFISQTRQHDLMPRLSRCTPRKYAQVLDFRGVWMTNSATKLVNTPEEQHKSLDERPEVIMLVDGTFSVLFNRNVPKQLVK